jgi:hypothetical protein
VKEIEMNQGKHTVNDLLMSCPDDEITRMGTAWKAIAAGDKKEAAHVLRNVAASGDSSWHDWCAELADHLQCKGDLS